MYKNANKRRGIMAALLVLIFGVYEAAPAARAQEPHRADAEGATNLQMLEAEQAVAWAGLSSRGNLVYREGEKGAQVYAADFILLKDKLDTIPGTVFEPAGYTYSNRREYPDVKGNVLAGYGESCEYALDRMCGYHPEHVLVFEAVDETSHRSRCCLDGTAYCPGYEPVLEEHYAYSYEACDDGRHHEKICVDCGYRSREECSFSLPGAGCDGEDGRCYCWCGNAERPEGENEDENAEAESVEKAGDEAGEEHADAEPWEDNPGTEMGEESPDEKAEEEKPATETVAG